MRNILRKYSLIGYHCTKLTEAEIRNIHTNGMVLQSATSLNKRIDSIEMDGMITTKVAGLLRGKNQANDSNRVNMLWFCFFEPHFG